MTKKDKISTQNTKITWKTATANNDTLLANFKFSIIIGQSAV